MPDFSPTSFPKSDSTPTPPSSAIHQDPLSEDDLAELCAHGVRVGGRVYANLGELLDGLCVHGHAPTPRDPADMAHRASRALEISALAAALPQLHGTEAEIPVRNALKALAEHFAHDVLPPDAD